jgi:hypothetical protein
MTILSEQEIKQLKKQCIWISIFAFFSFIVALFVLMYGIYFVLKLEKDDTLIGVTYIFSGLVAFWLAKILLSITKKYHSLTQDNYSETSLSILTQIIITVLAFVFGFVLAKFK